MELIFKKRKYALVFGLLIFSSLSHAVTTEVPNEFTSGSPAKAQEVNENFTTLESAIDDNWSRYPDRYYPDWRHDNSFYLSLPTMGNRWKGRLNSEYGYGQTSHRNLNFINAYDSGNRFNRIWLGISVVPSPDASVAAESRLAAGFDEKVTNVYTLSLSHHKDGTYANIQVTRDLALDSLYGSSQTNWMSYLSSTMITSLLSELYNALDLANDVTVKSCGTLSFYMNESQEVTFSAQDCTSITPS